MNKYSQNTTFIYRGTSSQPAAIFAFKAQASNNQVTVGEFKLKNPFLEATRRVAIVAVIAVSLVGLGVAMKVFSEGGYLPSLSSHRQQAVSSSALVQAKSGVVISVNPAVLGRQTVNGLGAQQYSSNLADLLPNKHAKKLQGGMATYTIATLSADDLKPRSSKLNSSSKLSSSLPIQSYKLPQVEAPNVIAFNDLIGSISESKQTIAGFVALAIRSLRE